MGARAQLGWHEYVGSAWTIRCCAFSTVQPQPASWNGGKGMPRWRSTSSEHKYSCVALPAQSKENPRSSSDCHSLGRQPPAPRQSQPPAMPDDEVARSRRTASPRPAVIESPSGSRQPLLWSRGCVSSEGSGTAHGGAGGGNAGQSYATRLQLSVEKAASMIVFRRRGPDNMSVHTQSVHARGLEPSIFVSKSHRVASATVQSKYRVPARARHPANRHHRSRARAPTQMCAVHCCRGTLLAEVRTRAAARLSELAKQRTLMIPPSGRTSSPATRPPWPSFGCSHRNCHRCELFRLLFRGPRIGSNECMLDADADLAST